MRINQLVLFTILISLFACNKNEPRKPIQRRTASFFKESIEENKRTNAIEEEEIERIIALDSLKNYESSPFGFWFTYENKVENLSETPKSEDVVVFNYEIKNLYGEIIYSAEEIGDQKLIIDKRDAIQGLNEGLKMMHEGEIITFIFPSFMAYGLNLQKEDERIGQKQPLIYKVELKSIIKNNQK
ncbi:gliding motility-associated peptidyl-prolyl isomerase GldI [Aureivirga marina]|uniref:gliding motility-associated peptidyl-prolyl isomerase GldI n=1 Tax=Aureivirga marina TaxID=1182451 RepID=UPI0018CB0714|nr:gliding motility-associated peptidyl-prolyl isomerase GldI [Aureivirga marina]